MSIRNIIFLIFTCIVININLYSKDSTRSISCIVGMYSFNFSNNIYDPYANVSFQNYNNYSFTYAIGLKSNHKLTSKKNLGNSLLYSNASMAYQYSLKNPPNPMLETNGKIKINGFLVSTMINYRLFNSNWFKLNYGLNSYILIKDKFDSLNIAKSIGWYNSSGKSNMKHITIAICIGFEIKIYKKLSLEYNHMEGLNNFIVLRLKDDPYLYNIPFPEKMKYGGLTLNYKLN